MWKHQISAEELLETAGKGTEPPFSLIVATSAYVFKLVRGWVKSLHLLTSRAVLKYWCSKADQKNYWVGWARSLELHSLANDPVAIFLYLRNEETGKP